MLSDYQTLRDNQRATTVHGSAFLERQVLDVFV